MALEEKIRQARRRQSIGSSQRHKALVQRHLAQVVQELDELREVHPMIRRCMREQGQDVPWYASVWRLVRGLFRPDEPLEQLYWRQQKGFSAIRAELGALLSIASEKKRRFEALYNMVCVQKQESEERLSRIQDNLESARSASRNADAKQCAVESPDGDALAKKIADLEYRCENQKDLAAILEKRRMHLHGICMHYLDVSNAYARLYQQAAAFEQESLLLHGAHEDFLANNKVAECLFGSLDAFITPIGDLRQAYQDSMQTATVYAQELRREAESSQRFQELD